MASAEERLEALRKLKRPDIFVYDDGSVVIWDLRPPFWEAWGKTWDDCLDRLHRKQHSSAQAR